MSRALESLHTVRRGEEARAREELGDELRAEARLVSAAAATESALERAEDVLREAATTNAVTAGEHQERAAYCARLRRLRASARQAHAAASAALSVQSRRVDAARDALALAHADKRAAETRIDRASEERKREAERREEDEASERR